MSREIKFRAWHKVLKAWCEVQAIKLTEPCMGNIMCNGRDVDADEIILMQFTGLHDKTGKEGYFDDLLKDDDGHIGIVKWSEKKLRVYFEWNDGQISYPADVYDYIGFEFIGDIHTTPNLMEKEK